MAYHKYSSALRGSKNGVYVDITKMHRNKKPNCYHPNAENIEKMQFLIYYRILMNKIVHSTHLIYEQNTSKNRSCKIN